MNKHTGLGRSDDSPKVYDDAAVVGAIRLAVEGTTDAWTLRKVLANILSHARPSYGIEPVALLIDAAQEANATWVVTDHASKVVR